MAVVTASTAYKKQDGTLTFDPSKNSVSWAAQAAAASPPTISIAVSDIVNLQQTPATNPKVALRLVVQPSTVATPENFTFNFQAPSRARAEQEAITDALRDAITKAKQQQQQQQSGATKASAVGTSGQTPGDSDGHSAAMAVAAAVKSTGTPASTEIWYDDQKLKTNVELQQSLLDTDPALRQRFRESLREKPDSISNFQFSQQFWSARLHLLRAHAIEKNQNQGVYNVLAEVKPKIVDGAARLNLSKEQIQLIFSQHPIVKFVYNDVVPKISEREFDADPTDVVLDKYLRKNEEELRNKQIAEARIPHFIDLEGNEQNHSRQQGNRPDITMRPNAMDKVPILRVLNNMSEKMVAQITPNEGDAHAPVGALDSETFNELRLRDLQMQTEDDRIILRIKHQNKLFGAGGGGVGQDARKNGDGERQSEEARAFADQEPVAVLSTLRRDVHQPLELSSTLLEQQRNADDMENDEGDRSSSLASTTGSVLRIFSLIGQQRALLYSTSNNSTLSSSTLQSLQLTHNTTTEFLHYFWALLLASTPSHPHKELPELLGTLSNSLKRIAAVAQSAEQERQTQLDEVKRRAAEYTRRTGKRPRVDESAVNVGGQKEVEALMEPTIRAIGIARDRYQAPISSEKS